MIPGVSNHARERMVERHGRDLTRAEWLAVVLAIIDRRAVLVRLGHGGAGDIYDVELGSVRLRLIWNPGAGVVTTVLHDGAACTRKAEQAKRAGIRTSVRIGRGYYDKEGNRL